MILILGGTSDSHEYIAALAEPYIVSVATSYGHREFSEHYGNKVVQARFSTDSLVQFIKSNKITKIVDTTHPFAREISRIAVHACAECGIDYVNAKRSTDIAEKYMSYRKLHLAGSFEEAAAQPFLASGKLFFTIGSKNLHFFSKYLDKALVRVLDDAASVEICRGLGVADDCIIAAKGPFSVQDNIRAIDEHGITCIITKESGAKGGFEQKADAAMLRDIDLLVITL